MIKAFPKIHLLAMAASFAIVFILVMSPSDPVEANKAPLSTIAVSDAAYQENGDTVSVELQIPPLTKHTDVYSANAPQNKKSDEKNWKTYTVKNGDTLSTIFRKAGFNDSTMYGVLGKKGENKALSNIFPGEKISFLMAPDDSLYKIKLQRSKLEALMVEKKENLYKSRLVTRTPETQVAYAAATIKNSLFLAGQKAGISEAKLMELANIFAWDIDFALDIRAEDKFAFTYEELYLDGKKIGDGKILAASFTNQGKTYKAVLFKQPDGDSNYFTPEGDSMRKAFLRTPVDFARVTSHFSLNRWHPVLHKMRSHKGTDYAGARGTPIRSTGDGKVIHAGRKGGYGNAVIVQHGQGISTLYAHMSKFGRGIRRGKRVSQGQIIGYIGSTGLATGPHLHYEFRVNGVQKNPEKVRLPHAKPVAKNLRAAFTKQSKLYLAQLNTFGEQYQLASSQ